MISILEQYKYLSKPVKASIWFVFSSFLLKGIAFITLPIFTRILTTSEYGTLALYQTWVSIFLILTTLSVSSGGILNVSLTKFSDRKSEIISSYQGIAITITAFILLISLLFLNNVSSFLGISKILVVCMFLEIMFQVPFGIWATSQRYEYEYKNLVKITVLNSILNPLISISAAVYFASNKVEAVIISSIILTAIMGITFFVYNLKRGKLFYSKELWKFCFLFGIVLVPHYLSSQILNQSDRIMINWFCGSSDVGIYSAGYSFGMVFMLILSGIEASLTPYIYKCLKENKVSALYKKTSDIILFEVIFACIFICFLPDIFRFILPIAYYPAIYVIPPVLVGVFFNVLYNLFGAVEFYFEENKYVTIASVIGAILNILLNYIFIPIYGFIAAAYTTLLCYMAFCFCHYIFMKKVLKKNNFKEKIYNLKNISLFSCFLLVFMFIMLSIYSNFFIRWFIIITACCILYIKRFQIIKFIKELKE